MLTGTGTVIFIFLEGEKRSDFLMTSPYNGQWSVDERGIVIACHALVDNCHLDDASIDARLHDGYS